MDCFNICAVCCSSCCDTYCPCFGKERKSKEKYPHIEYYQPVKAHDIVQTPEAPYHKVPLQKIFEFPQQDREFRTHTQVGQQLSVPHLTITRQPDEGFEPMYVSSRGRTLDTISDLQPHSSGSPYESEDERPFTPPQDKSSVMESTLSSEFSLQFSLYYDIQRRMLAVTLQCACSVPSKAIAGSSDFFVSLFLLPNREQIHQTKIQSGTDDVLFNQMFSFQGIISEELYEQVLVLQLFSHDKHTRDHLLGTVVVPLKEADLLGVTMFKKIGDGREMLQKYATGDLLLSLRHSARSHKLQGIILKVTNLPRPHKWGLADPYVKVYLLHKHKRMNKWKSTVKHSTLVPVFNESFAFDITGMDLLDINLEVFVMDHGRFRKNDIMGMVYIGPNVPSALGGSHYTEVLCNPHHPISHWHQLIPHHQAKERKRRQSQTM